MSFLDNGQIRLGVDLALGGAITYLSTSYSSANLVNSYDRGREIQMSFYSGPVPFQPPGSQLQQSWAGLGWNPIQVGDSYGNRSQILKYRNDGKSLYVRCIPMQWPLNNVPGECVFESWIHLEGKSAVVRSRITNHRIDVTQYPARDQEMPAIYTNGPWSRLVSYTGDRPFTRDSLKDLPVQFPWTGWQATEHWAALVNDKGEGLGVWSPGVTTFIGGFAGHPAQSGPSDFPCGYIAPLGREILDHNIAYDYDYRLIVGRLEEIKQAVYAQEKKQEPPTFVFSKDRQHWSFGNTIDDGWPIKGEIKLYLDGANPQMIGPTGYWRAEQAPKLTIVAAYRTSELVGRVLWKRFDAPTFDEDRSFPFMIRGDGQFHTYSIDLSHSPEYRGTITGLRFDPVPSGAKGDFVRVRSISLHR